MRVQTSPEGTGGVLRALAVMEDEAAVVWRALPADRTLYRVDRDPLGDAPGHRPAHDLAGEGVYHGREIEPPFFCGHVGDVARPKPVAPAHGESALHRAQPGSPGSTFLWMRRFRAAPFPASPGFRMTRSARLPLTAMPLFRSSRLTRR